MLFLFIEIILSNKNNIIYNKLKKKTLIRKDSYFLIKNKTKSSLLNSQPKKLNNNIKFDHEQKLEKNSIDYQKIIICSQFCFGNKECFNKCLK